MVSSASGSRTKGKKEYGTFWVKSSSARSFRWTVKVRGGSPLNTGDRWPGLKCTGDLSRGLLACKSSAHLIDQVNASTAEAYPSEAGLVVAQVEETSGYFGVRYLQNSRENHYSVQWPWFLSGPASTNLWLAVLNDDGIKQEPLDGEFRVRTMIILTTHPSS
ncbi:uncharacterized protein BKA78DRAFT_291114 [Phyllosticta capitalensis]|uniref:uncharacterized protein n=1 Tax=Phyllosticta capitalensis TaxID=121624 RepID=UPI00312FCA56